MNPEPPNSYERLIQLIVILALIWLLVAGLLGCGSLPETRSTEPWNRPKNWEYNKHFEGFQAAFDAYKALTAPKGMLWDHLTQSYQQDLRDP